MTDLINGRTPEEIKRNLSYLVRCENCPQNHEYGCDYDKQTEECRTVNDALALIEHLEAQPPKWISVKERLPKYAVVALVYVHHYSAGIAELKGSIRIAMFIPPNRSWKELPEGCVVTHWMPLPEPPKGEK